MNFDKHAAAQPREVIRTLAVHWRRWLVPMLALGFAAAVYSLLSQPTWQASQALIIRNEAANSDAAPGKFGRADEMKTIQETILELVKGRAVLTATLGEVGPPADRASLTPWPSDREVEHFRQAVRLSPPKGAEFGATEVFYLEVRDSDRDRAVALNRALSAKLQAGFQQLRDVKAQSMIAELTKTVALANADLGRSIAPLSKIEREVGSDLAELRVLNDATSGDSAIRRTVTEIESELRQARTAQKANEQLLAQLRAARDDPGRLLATPNRLLESQPALRRLKDGLLDAQLHTASLQGHMSAAHPLVRSSHEAEEEIGRHLHGELAIALRGVESDLRFSAARVADLEARLQEATRRLSRLAELRATYANQQAETTSRTRLLERAEQNLAEARAAQASAKAASLLSCIDDADAGTTPVSPSRAMTILAGLAGGLLVGLGIVFLSVQSPLPAPAIPAAGAPGRPMATRPAAFSPAGNLSLSKALGEFAHGKPQAGLELAGRG